MVAMYNNMLHGSQVKLFNYRGNKAANFNTDLTIHISRLPYQPHSIMVPKSKTYDLYYGYSENNDLMIL